MLPRGRGPCSPCGAYTHRPVEAQAKDMTGHGRAELQAAEQKQGLTDGRLAPTGPDDEEGEEDDADSADDDVGDVPDGLVGADAQDGALGVDAHGSGGGVCGCVDEDRRGMVFQLGGRRGQPGTEGREWLVRAGTGRSAPGGRRDCTRGRRARYGRGAGGRRTGSWRPVAGQRRAGVVKSRGRGSAGEPVNIANRARSKHITTHRRHTL